MQKRGRKEKQTKLAKKPPNFVQNSASCELPTPPVGSVVFEKTPVLFVVPGREMKPVRRSVNYAWSLLKAQLKVWSKRRVIDSVHLHIKSFKSVCLVHTRGEQRMHLPTEI